MSSHYGYSPYLWLPLAAGGLFAALAIYASRRRSVPGAIPFAIAMAFALPFAAGAALAGAAVDPSAKIIWTEFQMIWLLPAVTAEMCFLLEYASLSRWLTRRNLILLAVPPCVFAGLAMTNHLHHLLWVGLLLERYVHPVRAWGGWAFTAYGYVIVLASAIVLIRLFISSPRHRFPAALSLFGQFVGRSIFLIEAAHVNPVAPMDIVVFGKVFTAACYALALFQFRMFQLIPVARGILIEQMGEGVVVVDTEQHIVDINPAVERILRIPAQRARGSNAVDILPQLAACLRHPTVADLPITVDVAESPKHYTLKVSPLKHRRGFRLGWLLLLQDVTAEELANAKLLEQQRAMAALHERVVIARELHDSFGQVLGYVKMQGQAVRDSLARGKERHRSRTRWPYSRRGPSVSQ